MLLQLLAESIWPLSGHSHFDLGTGIVSRLCQRGITHQGPTKVFYSLHPDPPCYLMGCDCDLYMYGECGHFQLGLFKDRRGRPLHRETSDPSGTAQNEQNNKPKDDPQGTRLMT